MKKLSFFALAIAGTLFAACSDKDLVVTDGGGANEQRPDGYMTVSINLPTAPSVRAANDVYDDGKPEEYAVSDCALLLFQGTSEATATLINAQEILLPFDSKEDDTDANGADNITTTYQATARVNGYNGPGPDESNKLYALVVLNYKDIMTIGNNGMPTFLSGGTTNVPCDEYTTLKDLRMATTSIDLTKRASSKNKDYFFMTNALLSEYPGGATKPVVKVKDEDETETETPVLVQLAELDFNNIKDTPEEAQKYPAGDIIVERAVAKATLSYSTDVIAENTYTNGTPASSDDPNAVDDDDDDNGNTPTNSNYVSFDIASVEWTIDNMEPSSYIVRNPGYFTNGGLNLTEGEEVAPYIVYASGANNNYRFVGNVSIAQHAAEGDNGHMMTKNYYRTYWCVDPQYNKTATGMLPVLTESTNDEDETTTTLKPAPVYVTALESNSNSDDEATPLYCNENTFDVTHQTYQNTTRAIVKVNLENKLTFYTVNGGSEIYMDETENGEEGKKAATSFIVNYVLNNTAVVTTFSEYLNTTKGITEYELKPSFFNFVYERNEVTGQLELKKLTLLKAELDKETVTIEGQQPISVFKDGLAAAFNGEEGSSNSIAAEVIASANKKVVVNAYEKGEVFYEARFQHFANDLAPWRTGNDWEGEIESGGTNKIYPASADGNYSPEMNYLGRYGMVRNNWYDVEVTKFLKLGLPTDPSGRITGDDTPDDNIEQYISCKIHILAWAKRTQSWQLK